MLHSFKYVIFLWNSQLFLDLDKKRMAFYNYLNEDIKHVEIFENYLIVPTFYRNAKSLWRLKTYHRRLRDSWTNPCEANWINPTFLIFGFFFLRIESMKRIFWTRYRFANLKPSIRKNSDFRKSSWNNSFTYV
jgi:hypothetical protein